MKYFWFKFFSYFNRYLPMLACINPILEEKLVFLNFIENWNSGWLNLIVLIFSVIIVARFFMQMHYFISEIYQSLILGSWRSTSTTTISGLCHASANEIHVLSYPFIDLNHILAKILNIVVLQQDLYQSKSLTFLTFLTEIKDQTFFIDLCFSNKKDLHILSIIYYFAWLRDMWWAVDLRELQILAGFDLLVRIWLRFLELRYEYQYGFMLFAAHRDTWKYQKVRWRMKIKMPLNVVKNLLRCILFLIQFLWHVVHGLKTTENSLK